ncbi:EscU/YscU/HrcU family type III secretion system export apparatus switch protein, partial [Pseudomonas sp. GP01-A4]
MADNDQKTFDPTEKKLADARAKGDMPSSPEMKHAAMFAAAIVVVGGMGTYT